MDELPDLVLELICESLNYNDLLNLRLTCKKLKKFIYKKEFQNLYLFYRQHHFYYDLFYTNESICYPNSFTTNDLQILNSFKFKNNFNKLRKLIIIGQAFEEKDTTINLNELNHFTELVHLEISRVECIKGRLSSNYLRVCFLDDCGKDEEKIVIELDCPNLIALKFYLYQEPKLIGDTNNLKYLWIKVYKNSYDYLFDFCSSLQNLSTICFFKLESLNHFLILINDEKLNLPSLKRIEINQIFKPKFVDFDIQYIDNILIPNLSAFVKYKSTKDFKFFWNDQLISPNEFKAINHELPDRQSFKYQIDYSEIERFFQNSTALGCLLPEIGHLTIEKNLELDEKIIEKMKNLFFISFEGKLEKSEYQLILRSCSKIIYLHLGELNFESSELDQLPDHIPNLRGLEFSRNCKIENFYFIGKLKNLRDLQLPQIQLQREVLTYLLNNCSYLTYITFDGIHQDITLITSLKTYSEKFEIRCTKNEGIWNSKTYKFDTLISLIDYYYEKNLFKSEFIE